MNFSALRRFLALSDWLLTTVILTLIGLGIVFIYSAGYQGEDVPVTGFYQRQILWAVLGLSVYFFFAVTDYRRLVDGAWGIYIAVLVLLILVLLIGKRVYGATRWLSVFNVQVQPSELAKLSLLLILARYLGRPGQETRNPMRLVKALMIVAVPFVLIAKQPDLGTAMTFIPVTLVMLFAARTPTRYLMILGLIGLMCLPVAWFALGDYQRERLLVFVSADRDPLGAGWNKIQSQIAVGSGGFSGKGYLKGTQNVLGYLPRTVAPTDFVYSVIAEETGFVGSIIVLSLYSLVLVTACRASLVAREQTGRLLAVGIMSMIFFHVFVNIAMTIGLVPITGLPLPLISYGGSFIVSMMAALGIVQSVYMRRIRR